MDAGDEILSAEGHEAGLGDAGSEPCAHLGCGCDVDPAYRFCSPFCRAHVDQPTERGPAMTCGCEHDACRAVVGEA